MTLADRIRQVTEKAAALNGAALTQFLAGLDAGEWLPFCDWLETIEGTPTAFGRWYQSNEIAILTAWTKGAQF